MPHRRLPLGRIALSACWLVGHLEDVLADLEGVIEAAVRDPW